MSLEVVKGEQTRHDALIVTSCMLAVESGSYKLEDAPNMRNARHDAQAMPLFKALPRS